MHVLHILLPYHRGKLPIQFDPNITLPIFSLWPTNDFLTCTQNCVYLYILYMQLLYICNGDVVEAHATAANCLWGIWAIHIARKELTINLLSCYVNCSDIYLRDNLQWCQILSRDCIIVCDSDDNAFVDGFVILQQLHITSSPKTIGRAINRTKCTIHKIIYL